MGKQHDQDNSYLLHGDARTYKLNFRMMHEGHCAALEAVPVARATPARCLTGVEAKKNSSSGAEPKEAGEDDSEEDEPVEIRVGETLRGAGLGSAEEEGERLVQDRGLAEPAYELLVLGVRLDKAVVLGQLVRDAVRPAGLVVGRGRNGEDGRQALAVGGGLRDLLQRRMIREGAHIWSRKEKEKIQKPRDGTGAHWH